MFNKEKLITKFVRITQFATWPILYPFFHVMFRIEIINRHKIDNISRPFIIVANHTNFYDSFIFRIVFGFKYLPLRFMAVTKFDWDFLNKLADCGIINFVYSLFGVFTVTPGLGIEKNLIRPIDIIRNGGNVLIYPEGRIIHSEHIGPFKKGAVVLAQKTGRDILPICMKFTKTNSYRKHLKIIILKKFRCPAHKSSDVLTNELRDIIVAVNDASESHSGREV